MRCLCVLVWLCLGLGPLVAQDALEMWIDRGSKLLKASQYDRAQVCFEQAMKHYQPRKSDSLNLASIYFGFAEVAYRTNHYDDGLAHAREALAIRRYCLGDETTFDMMDSYVQVGRLYRRKGNYEKTLEHYEYALEIELARAHPSTDRISLAYSDLDLIPKPG